jgi:hypothetical protein
MATAGVGLCFVPSRKGKGPPNNCGTCAAPSHSGPRLYPPSKQARAAAGYSRQQPAETSPSTTKPRDQYVGPTHQPIKPAARLESLGGEDG